MTFIFTSLLAHSNHNTKAFSWLLCGGLQAKGGKDGRSHFDPERGRRQGPRRNRVEKLLGQARFKLIETGTRNRLIHTPRGGKRSRAPRATGNVPDQVFTNLVRENRPLSFLATPEIAAIQREAARLKAPRLVTPKTSFRNGLQTSLSPELLHKRLHAIHRDAKTAEEERGSILVCVLVRCAVFPCHSGRRPPPCLQSRPSARSFSLQKIAINNACTPRQSRHALRRVSCDARAGSLVQKLAHVLHTL